MKSKILKSLLHKKPRPAPILESWESECCFQDQEEIFTNLLKDIESAKTSIDIEMFIFILDDLGNKIIKELKKAHRRGVKIRLIVDGLGSPEFTPGLVSSLIKDGINVSVFNPWEKFWPRLGRVFLDLKFGDVFNTIFSMNCRDHRKIITIDNSISWVGSANIGQKYSSWRETMVRVTGTPIKDIIEGFNWVWNRSESSKELKVLGNSASVSHNFSPINKWRVHKFRTNFIKSAKKRIYISSPYFIPPYAFLAPLLKARKRGVEVILLTSNRATTDYFFIPWFSTSYYNLLLKKGIKIYEMNEHFIHSKVIIVDNKAMVGTSNYNYRSFNCDLEIDLLLNDPKTVDCLEIKWKEDLSISTHVKSPERNRILNFIIKLLGPLKKNS